MICALVFDLSKGCTARRKGPLGGKQVFGFPSRKQPVRYRTKDERFERTTRGFYGPRLLGLKNGESINADCKFASTEKSLSTFRQKLKAELGCRNCHGRGTRALAMAIVFRCPRRSSGLAGPRRIVCNRKLMGVFLPSLLSSIIPMGDQACRGQALPKNVSACGL